MPCLNMQYFCLYNFKILNSLVLNLIQGWTKNVRFYITPDNIYIIYINEFESTNKKLTNSVI